MKDLYLFSCKREILARKLESLPITIPLKPIRPETALRRALSLNLDQKRYAFEESSFEKVNDKPVQIILSREALSNGDIDAGVGKAYVERGRVEVNTLYPEIRNSLENGFRFHMETAITRDLSIVVTKYLAACMGIPVRPKNGEIYFALERYIPEVLELMTVMTAWARKALSAFHRWSEMRCRKSSNEPTIISGHRLKLWRGSQKKSLMRPTPKPSTRGSKTHGTSLSRPQPMKSVSAWSLTR
jgi:hypothetical protein